MRVRQKRRLDSLYLLRTDKILWSKSIGLPLDQANSGFWGSVDIEIRNGVDANATGDGVAL